MRQPQPFFRQFTQSWYVEIRGKQINLGRDKKQGWAKYQQLMAARDELDAHTTAVVTLFETYLEWVQANRSPATYDAAARYLSSFAVNGRQKTWRWTGSGGRLKNGALR